MSKGDVLSVKDIPNLPENLEGVVLNLPLVHEFGEPRTSEKIISEARSKGEATKKINLQTELAKYVNAEDFVIKDP